MRKTILYLSHAGPKYQGQTRYSGAHITLLALLLERNRGDFRVAVYTDRPDQAAGQELASALERWNSRS